MSDNFPEPRREVPEAKAKQGRWGGQVLVILIAALILLAIGWWAVEIYGESIEPANPVGDPQTTPSQPSDG